MFGGLGLGQDITMYRGELARCADLLAFQLGKETTGQHLGSQERLCKGQRAFLLSFVFLFVPRKSYHNMLDWAWHGQLSAFSRSTMLRAAGQHLQQHKRSGWKGPGVQRGHSKQTCFPWHLSLSCSFTTGGGAEAQWK